MSNETSHPSIAAAIETWYRAAVAAVEPAAAVARHLHRDKRTLLVDGTAIPVVGRLIVVGVGKAAVGMARGAEAALGDLISGGLAITKDGHADPPLPAKIAIREASHPIPNERGVAATREILALLDALGSDDVVLALISGGGSALLEAPRPPVTLADLAATTDLLLRAGAPIQDLNAVRIPMSLVKGGGLLRAANPGRIVTLILSDVLGNDPRVIASGPTVPGDATSAAARALLERYGVVDRVPASVQSALATERGVRTQTPPDRADPVVIVGDNAAAMRATIAAAAADGFVAEPIWTARGGEAADLGREWVAACAATTADVLLGGGEATVTVRGDGRGGRNTEFALAAALAMESRGIADWSIASLATDGQDALTGVAGAIADGQTAARARAAGVDPDACLATNDSLRVFEAAGGIVAPGPTGTNVNDLYLAVRLGSNGDEDEWQ